MLKDRLGMVILIASTITAMGTIAGYFGLKNMRPLWVGEFAEAKAEIDGRHTGAQAEWTRRYLWALRRDKRLTEEAIEWLKLERSRNGDSAGLVERQVKLNAQLDWIDRGIASAERDLEKLKEDR